MATTTSQPPAVSQPPEAAEQIAAVQSGIADGIKCPRAVYGIGPTPEAAIAAAQNGDTEADYDTIPITAEAAAYVERHGGAPDPRLVVSRDGVTLGEEDLRESGADPLECDDDDHVAADRENERRARNSPGYHGGF